VISGLLCFNSGENFNRRFIRLGHLLIADWTLMAVIFKIVVFKLAFYMRSVPPEFSLMLEF